LGITVDALYLTAAEGKYSKEMKHSIQQDQLSIATGKSSRQ